MLAEDIKRTYDTNVGTYSSLKEEVKFEIEQAFSKTDIKYHSITARVKDLNSLLEKVQNKEVNDPFSEIPDIVGARIVTLFLSDINRIIELLKNAFDVSFVDNKIDDTDPRLFGYFSVHLHAKIKSSFVGTRYDQIKAVTFEIQVRTIAMDAWASASHYLAYKTEADVPTDLKRDFNALSGLYYVADKHFEMFFRAKTANLKKMDRAFKSHSVPIDTPLDLDALTAFLKDKYPDRQQPDGSGVAALLDDIRKRDIKDLKALTNFLDSVHERFLEHELNHPPGPKPAEGWIPGEEPKFAAVGVVRVSLNSFFKKA